MSPEAVEQVEEALAELVLTWDQAVENNDIVQYANWKGTLGVRSLMVPAGVLSATGGGNEGLAAEFPPTDVAWATLTSLRNVDQESTLKIISPNKRAVTQHGDE